MRDEEIRKLTKSLGQNTLVITSDADGAQGHFKIRGLDAYEIGKIYGSAMRAVQINAEGFAEQMKRQAGPSAALDFAAGFAFASNPENHNGHVIATDRRDERR
jgi:hypothetical protein